MKYIIKKGQHYANFTLNRLFPFASKKQSGSFMFDDNCLEKETIPGWNKLCGISSLRIHQNSGRLVWRSDGNMITIAGYVYSNGERSELEIIKVPVCSWIKYKIENKRGFWHFTVNGVTVLLGGSVKGLKFKCYPYFGGRSTAPKTMEIWISSED